MCPEAAAMQEPECVTPVDIFVIGDASVLPWNMEQRERLRRILSKLDVPAHFHDGAPAGVVKGEAVIIRGDWVFEERLVRALLDTGDVIIIAKTEDGQSVPVAAHVRGTNTQAAYGIVAAGDREGADSLADVVSMSPSGLCGGYNEALRKFEAPYVLPLVPGSRKAVEQRMFAASYKGVTDLVTKYLWPWPALRATRAAARLGLTPNMITYLSLAMVIIAMQAFWVGAFWTGLAAAYVMVFLDTVDGKLARVTVTSSRWGNVFDHGIDLIHPPFWYWAWWAGIEAVDPTLSEAMRGWCELALATNIVGYMVGRLIEGIFIKTFGFEMHVWKPIDSRMREITARRNPNLLLLTIGLLVAGPETGFLVVAVWTVVCTLFHAVRLCQAMGIRAKQRKVESWMAQAA